MQPKTKIILILIAIFAASLACATFSEEVPTQTPPPPAATPTTPPPPTSTTPPKVDSSILLQDDFSDPNSGWDIWSDEGGITDYSDGKYLIGVYTDTYFYWANPYRTFQDVVVEVDTEMLTDEEDNQFGIICRQSDLENWYVLVISGDGYAAIRKRFQGGDLEYLTDWAEVAAINTGKQVNRLRAECVGDRLSLFVNGVLAIEASDFDLPTGDVGLLAGTFSATQTEIAFDNFIVTNP